MSYEMTDDRKLVISHMKYDGKHTDALPSKYGDRIYRMADGFGAAPPPYPDWSHIRDSSNEAMKRMANEIRRMREELGLGEADLSEPLYG